MAKQQKAATRERILSSATELFFKQGLEVTTFAQIAKKSGVTQPAIYAHFSDKMDLLGQVILTSVEKGRAQIDEKVSDRDPALTRIKNYLNANLDFFSSDKINAHSLMAGFYFGLSDPKIGVLYRAIRERTIERLEILILQAIREGSAKTKDAKSSAEVIYSCLVGTSYDAIYLEKPSGLREIKNRLWRVAETSLVA